MDLLEFQAKARSKEKERVACLDRGLPILMVFNIAGVTSLASELRRWCTSSSCGHLCRDSAMIYL